MGETCQVCKGTGLKSSEERCPECEGYGSTEKYEEQVARERAEEELEKQNIEANELLEDRREIYRKIELSNAGKITDPTCCEEAKECGDIRYCKGDFIDPNGYSVESGWYLVYDEWAGYTKIEFCPFCGKELW